MRRRGHSNTEASGRAAKRVCGSGFASRGRRVAFLDLPMASQLPAPVRQRVENYQIGFPISVATNLTLARPPKGIVSARCYRKENRRRDTLLLLPCQGRMSSTATWQLAQRRPRMHNCVAHQLHTTHCRRRPSILISARSGCGRRGTTGRVGKKTISAWEGFLGQGTRGKRTKRTDCRSGGRKNKDKR